VQRNIARVSLIAFLIVGSAPVLAQLVERPEWKPGDTWTLRRTISSPLGTSTSELIRATSKGAPDLRPNASQPTTAIPSRPDRLAAEANAEIGAEEDTDAMSSEMRWLRWPLRPGEHFELEGTKDREWSGTVDGWDEVTTPAGTFKAMKVSLHATGGGGQVRKHCGTHRTQSMLSGGYLFGHGTL
jgi:hypothetical protein